MAYDLSAVTPVAKIDLTDLTNFPWGKAQNVTAFGDGTGFPWNKIIANDIIGWQASIFTEANLTPNGTSETALSSQYLTGSKILHGIVVSDLDDLLTQPTALPVGTSATSTESGKEGLFTISAWTAEVDDDTTVKVNATWEAASKYWKKVGFNGVDLGLKFSANTINSVDWSTGFRGDNLYIGTDTTTGGFPSAQVIHLGGTATGTTGSIKIGPGYGISATYDEAFPLFDSGYAGTNKFRVNATPGSSNMQVALHYLDKYAQCAADTGGSRVLATTDAGNCAELSHASPIVITINTGALAVNEEAQFIYDAAESNTVTFTAGAGVSIQYMNGFSGTANPGSWLSVKRSLDSGGNEVYRVVGGA